MNISSKLFMGFAALGMLAACSSDEPNNGGNGNGVTDSGENAYLNITLRDANDLSRAGENDEEQTADGGFTNGTGNEGDVTKAYFYFFDSKGNYMGQANVWNGGTQQPNGGNIEFKSPSLVVLENVKKGANDEPQYPTYMVTVLNGPHYTNADLTGQSLADFGKSLTTWGANEKGGFIMTTTSYYLEDDAKDKDKAEHDDAYWYATKINKDAFQRTPELAIQTPGIDVYVERLAVRIGLKSKAEFPITETIFGAEGDNPEINNPADNEPADNEPAEAASQLYVRIDGWFINGTQPESYLSKQLGANWDNTPFPLVNSTDSWIWNMPGFHRSYWGQSVGYGNIDPATLKFYNYNTASIALSSYGYCNENTTTKTDLMKDNNGRPNQQKLTSVVVKATVGAKDANGNFTPVTFIEHNGLYYTPDRFIAYICDLAKHSVGYTYSQVDVFDEEGNKTGTEWAYIPVPAEKYIIAGNNSHVYVTLASDYPTPENGLYKKNADGSYSATTLAEIKTAVESMNKGLTTYQATGGSTYYNIPIAHLNTATKNANGDIDKWEEGSFGVVRNHSYEISINTVKHLGTGVFDPNGDKGDDPIKPNPDPQDPTWYLGATINILSWKIVNNYVDL